MTESYRRAARWVLAALFVAAGALHFLVPGVYLRIMPPPYPRALVYISGATEVLGGVGVLIPATRRWAGWGLIALLVAVFPANIHMAAEGPGARRIALHGGAVAAAAASVRAHGLGVVVRRSKQEGG